MRTKRVNRYYCDYCKKSGCVARWIKKHEERCTMNPNRYCGFCHLRDLPQPDIKVLLAILPDPDAYKTWCDYTGEVTGFDACLGTSLDAKMAKLREATENCPACIMAALRQKGIPVPMANGFSFSKESQAIWDEFNSARVDEAQRDEAYYL